MPRKVVFYSDESIGIYDIDNKTNQQLEFLFEGVCFLRHCTVLRSFTLDDSSFVRWFHDSVESCSRYSGEV